jgi:hypothetical protein
MSPLLLQRQNPAAHMEVELRIRSFALYMAVFYGDYNFDSPLYSVQVIKGYFLPIILSRCGMLSQRGKRLL